MPLLLKKRPKPVVLVIRDGWGVRDDPKGNAVTFANIPYTKFLLEKYPHTLLDAHGPAVGLSGDAIGSSEVGHLNMGAGRVIKQTEVRISDEIVTGEFFSNSAFLQAIEHCKKHNSAIHLFGLLQDAGVHADQEHLFALLKLCSQHLCKEQIIVHVFGDGRDTPPQSIRTYLTALDKEIARYPATIGTIIGRYYAMDRDNHWERTQVAYDGIVLANGERFSLWSDAITDAYTRGETDEFIKPRVIGTYAGMHHNDAIIFWNFRLDRTRQLTKMFRESSFKGVEQVRRDYLDNIFFVAMTEYYTPMNAVVAYPPIDIKNNLGNIFSRAGLKQLRISETEKYAHVTYFFNSQIETPNALEDRILIPSDRSVATYDHAPSMKVQQIAEKLVSELDNYDVIITNLVNADMVGHTGIFEATVKGLEAIDTALKLIVEEVRKRNGVVFITADHGNAEEMINADGSPKTAHTTNPVHLMMIDDLDAFGLKQKMGKLADIAPTMLARMNMDIPSEMTGENLLVRK